MARHGVAMIDVATPIESFDFSAADHWFVVVLLDGVPVAVVDTPSPGAVDSPELAEALFARRADIARWREAFLAQMERRMDARPSPSPAKLAVSVVVCTHRRPPADLRRFLDGLRALDPAPAEVVIVDNDPGPDDCEALVAEYGFTYVREPRRGLDNARNAGVRVTSGDVVAFTDDDVLVPRRWLDSVAECFSHPAVGASTGPVFPTALETPAQVRMERQASLARGVTRRVVDWTVLAPVHAGAVGAGANMFVRRSLLGVRPFPPDLDLGTEAGTGGDTYLLARVLAAGHRVVYEPRQFVLHEHRREWESLRSALVGYGKGVTSVCLKLGLQAGETEAPAAWWWLVRQYRQAQARRMRGTGDAVEVRLASLYLLGGLLGFVGAVRARQTQRRAGAQLELERVPPVGSGTDEEDLAVEEPVSSDVSVIVATVDRPAQLRRCVDALAAQVGVDHRRLELVVVDDSPSGSVEERGLQAGLDTRVVRTGGVGAAAARNSGAQAATGEIVLFLDDDLVPSPTLVRRHVAEHAARDGAVVIGRSPPSPRYERSSFLAASSVALWWHDHFRELRSARRLTFSEALAGNMSIRRADFERVGRFSESYGRHRREDWEFALRAIDAGLEIGYLDEAVAVHEFELPQGARFQLAALEGHGDGLLLQGYPEAIVALKAREARYGGPVLRAARVRAAPAVLPLLRFALPVLERLRLRRRWLREQNRGQRLAYMRGVWRAGAEISGEEREPRVAVEVTDDAPLPSPGAVAPVVALSVEGESIATFIPPEGHWNPSLWAVLADRLNAEQWRRIASALRLERPPPEVQLDEVTVVALGASAPPVEPGWRASTPLVAYVITDVQLDERQLRELVVAFRGERVGAALGRVVPGGRCAGPLTLHEGQGARALLPVWTLADVVMARTESAPTPEPSEPGLAFATRVTHSVLAAGQLVATRELHGEAGAVAEGRRARAAYILRSSRTLERPDRVRVALWLAIRSLKSALRRVLRRPPPARALR